MPGAYLKPGFKRRSGVEAVLAALFIILIPIGSAYGAGPYEGRRLQEVLEELRNAGAPLVYSSNLVTPDLVVESEPTANDPILIASEILVPHGLTLNTQQGIYVVVRPEPAKDDTDTGSTADGKEEGSAGEFDEPAELETIVVSASRYVLQSASQFFIDQRAIQALPDLGEDPLRSVHRLPGTAASGLSSKSHFRGGGHNETAIYLNGLQLLEPFHIRDYHSIFSSIDARAISGVEAYTGGFPVQFGDHMSGVLSLESQAPESPRHTELGLSVYNTSILHRGFSKEGGWDWLISARDSNLDLVLKPSLGSPDYFDIFTQLGRQLSDRTYLSFNALYAKDSVVVVTENDPEELEQSVSDTENQHFWIRWQTDWRPDLSSSTVLSRGSFENLRVAEVTDPEQMISRVRDWRKAEVWGLSQDWRWTGWSRHDVRWGLEYRDQSARYQYIGFAQYEGFLAELPGLESPRQYRIETEPEGHGTSLFVADRMNLSDATWLEVGVRWDRQTWTEPEFDDQLSPRASLLHRFDDNTDFRLSWGRYYQSQAVHRLQVEDGIDRFFTPQRSDHYIAGFRKSFTNGYRLRTELFLKKYDRLQPRFENLFDPLALIPEMAPDRVRLDPASAEARGVEISLERRTGAEVDWWVSYVFSRATDRIDERNELRSWDQRHAFQAGISWQRAPWEVGAAVSTHTGWPTTPLVVDYDPEEDEYLPIPGLRNSEQYSTFFTLDFRISREFDVRKGRLSAFLEVTNTTNRDNPCCTDYDINDDVDPAELDKTEDFWVPVIPAIGILWEF
jgi:outer membrane receptor protein involved in Fe transport